MSSWHNRPRLATWSLCDFVWGHGKNKNRFCENSPAQSVRFQLTFHPFNHPFALSRLTYNKDPFLTPSPDQPLKRREDQPNKNNSIDGRTTCVVRRGEMTVGCKVPRLNSADTS